MSFPAYGSYRESGVQWLGEAPSHWKVVRLKSVLAEPLKYGANEAADGDDPEQPRFVRITDIDAEGRLRDETFRSLPLEVAEPYLLSDGDLLFARSGATVGKSFIYRNSWGQCCYAGYLIRARTNGDHILSEFLYHCCQSDFYWQYVGADQIQSTIQNFSAEKYANLWLPVPPLGEQADIAAFLDRETAKIDALVEAQRRLIELLKEKRQAVISHAVTKGLDPSAPMKDSGVEWLGQVPAHWDVTRVKYAASHVVDCLHTTPTYDGELEFPAVRTADVERGRLLLNCARLVSREIYEERIQRLKPEAEDILYTREGERFGLAALVPSGIDLCLGQRMMMMRIAREYASAYVMWVLNSDPVYQQVVSGITGATAPHVNISEVINFHLPVPPLNEQRAIAAHIFASTAALDRLAEEAEAAITLLQERRAALISAAVTGKIDVRGLVETAEAA